MKRPEPPADTENATQPAAAAQKQAKAKTSPNSAPVPILVNPSFEQWKNLMPAGWQGSFPGEKEERVKVVIPVNEAHDGEKALRLKTAGERRIVWQTLNLPTSAYGKTLTCEAYAKNPVPGALYFRLSYVVNGEEISKDADREDAGEWTRLVITTQLPQNADPGSVKLTFLLRHFVTGAAIIDGVTVKTED